MYYKYIYNKLIIHFLAIIKKNEVHIFKWIYYKYNYLYAYK